MFLCGCTDARGFATVQYHLDEDPKTSKVFPVPLHDANGTTLHYDHLCLSPDGKILAATHGLTLQWLSAESGKVLETAERAHDGNKNIWWHGRLLLFQPEIRNSVLATARIDKKVKLWHAPPLHPS